MFLGKSVYHVDQGLGQAFKPNCLCGYFNDMTKKVTQGDKYLDNGIPFLVHSDGKHIQMPTMIFQYGLGAYDLWLIQKDDMFLQKAIICAEWGINHQEGNGAWNNFYYIYPNHPYSAMSQGEGASLLLRIFHETQDRKYLDSATNAIQFMLTDYKKNGVACYNNGLFLLEYTHRPVVLNGWIFALYGLCDYYLVTGNYKEELELTVKTLKENISKFDCGFWSKYDTGKRITSPFYHNLHIAQMEALSLTFDIIEFKNCHALFKKYRNNPIYKTLAILVKSAQKIIE